MVHRRLWVQRIERAWQHRSVLWLMGVRRVGKTTLAQSWPEADYLDCELPRVRAELADPEAFLGDRRGRTVILGEIHRLPRPAELLKIAADHYPTVRILATGSSTIGATASFRDTLTGRKTEVWLTPMTSADLTPFAAATGLAAGSGPTALNRRLLRAARVVFPVRRTPASQTMGRLVQPAVIRPIQDGRGIGWIGMPVCIVDKTFFCIR